VIFKQGETVLTEWLDARLKSLPFTLTAAQQKSLEEIRVDLDWLTVRTDGLPLVEHLVEPAGSRTSVNPPVADEDGPELGCGHGAGASFQNRESTAAPAAA
jgi:hypothetical protein